MAFITGVGLETKLAAESDDEDRIVPVHRSPHLQRSARPLALQNGQSALEDAPRQSAPVDPRQLLQTALALEEGDEDPLAELQRMIRRTRGKLDGQRKVLSGFISDVGRIRAEGGSDASSSTGSLTAWSPGKPQSAQSALALRKPQQGALTGLAPQRAEPRSLSIRSRSTPTLASAAILSLHRQEPLALPQRRAPPQAQRAGTPSELRPLRRSSAR